MIKCKRIDEIVSGIPSKKIQNKKDQLIEDVRTSLEPAHLFQIQSLLRLIDKASDEIKKIYGEIQRKSANFKEDLKIAIFMGMGFASAP